MGLRNQPYLALYVQDVLTDERLIECSAQAQGVFFRLLCVLHKQENYGVFLLKPKYKVCSSKRFSIIESACKNFGSALARSLALEVDVIAKGLEELSNEGVLEITEDSIIQKRMVRDAELSNKRALAGSKGGAKTQKQIRQKESSFAKPKQKANPENESEYENESVIEDIEKKEKVQEKGKERKPKPNPEPKPQLVYPWDVEVFRKKWDQWKVYRIEEHSFRYKSLISEQAALKRLAKISHGDMETAMEIIEESMSRRWEGLFELKTNGRNNKSSGKPAGYLDPYEVVRISEERAAQRDRSASEDAG